MDVLHRQRRMYRHHTESPNLFCINVLLKVTNLADIDEVRESLREAAQLSRKEPGCMRFEVCQAHDDPQHGWSVLTAVTKMRFSKVFAPFVNFNR